MSRLQIADCRPVRLGGLQTGKASAGVVLLEVVLALALFVATATTVGAALSRCSDAAARLRTRTRAADLAVTLLSEIQLGLVAPVSTDPTTYEEDALADWTWGIETEDVEDSDVLFRMLVTVTHEETGLKHSLGCLMTDPEALEEEAAGEEYDDMGGQGL